MQRKTKIALAAGVAGALTLGGAAGLAMAGGSWNNGMGGHRMMGMQMMERYDANKDGKLTQEEIDADRTAWHGEFDLDKNASLSLEEFKALWLKARNEMMVREFQQLDRDGNGQVTLDEYKDPLSQMVANLDRNGDGALSRDDRPEKHGKRQGRMRHGMGDGMQEGMGGMMEEDVESKD